METMGKQIRLLLSSLLLLASCLNSSSNELRNNRSDDQPEFNKQVVLDTSINDIALRDTSAVVKWIRDTDETVINDYNKGEGVQLLNKSENEILFLKKENGGYKNQYDYFFIEKGGISSSLAKKTIAEHFVSSKGAYLGIDETSFLQKYADIKFLINRQTDSTTYSYQDTIEPYRAKYLFVNTKLREFEFGYLE